MLAYFLSVYLFVFWLQINEMRKRFSLHISIGYDHHIRWDGCSFECIRNDEQIWQIFVDRTFFFCTLLVSSSRCIQLWNIKKEFDLLHCTIHGSRWPIAFMIKKRDMPLGWILVIQHISHWTWAKAPFFFFFTAIAEMLGKKCKIHLLQSEQLSWLSWKMKQSSKQSICNRQQSKCRQYSVKRTKRKKKVCASTWMDQQHFKQKHISSFTIPLECRGGIVGIAMQTDLSNASKENVKCTWFKWIANTPRKNALPLILHNIGRETELESL